MLEIELLIDSTMTAILNDNSVTRSFRLLAAGDSDAANLIWERFFPRLVRFARSRNARLTRGIVDEEEIALSALGSVCIGLRDGKFPELRNRDSLWRLLVVIAIRKSADKVAYETCEKRDANRTRSSASIPLGEASVSSQSDVEYRDLLDHLLRQLRHEDLKEVALLKLHGHKNEEIAVRLGRSRATVERKLKTIRTIWAKVA